MAPTSSLASGRISSFSNTFAPGISTMKIARDSFASPVISDHASASPLINLARTSADHFRGKLGLGSNVLNDRLRLLTAEGILERVSYQDSPPRHEYRLTAKGADLYPVLPAVMAWGDKYATEVPPVRLVHRACGHPAEARPTCAHCAEPVGRRDMTAELEPEAW